MTRLLSALCAVLMTVAVHAQDTMEQSDTVGEKIQADRIVTAAYVITMDAGNTILKDGAVAITGGVITAVGTRSDILEAYSAPDIIDEPNRALLPGLINGHSHSAMVLFRGMADDLPLMTWLQDYIFPMEGQFVDPDFIRAGASLACYEMIKGGTTTFVDMYFYPDVIAEVVEKCGIRATIAAPMIDYPSPGFKGWDDSYAAGIDFVRRWRGQNSRIRPALAPHAPYTVSFEHLKAAFAAARELDVPISIHLEEDRAEIKMIDEKYGTTSVQLLSRVGMLNQTTIGAHVVWPTPTDIAMLAKSKVGAIHNPSSNMKSGAGVSPVPDLLKAGVKVGLGTDGAASNNDLNMWEEMRLAALIHKGHNMDPTLMPAIDVLTMATKGGAAAIGMENSIGILKAGMQADMIQISLESPHLTPLYNITSHLVYAANASDMVTTIVAGKVLMRDGVVETLDYEKVRADANAIADKIKATLAGSADKVPETMPAEAATAPMVN